MSTDAITRPGAAFSTSDEWDNWEGSWCGRCVHDADFRAGKFDIGCPLVLLALCGEETPAQWWHTEPGAPDKYRCVEFRAPGDPDYEPRSHPEPPRVDGLFGRPARQVRMLTPSDTKPALPMPGGAR